MYPYLYYDNQKTEVIMSTSHIMNPMFGSVAYWLGCTNSLIFSYSGFPECPASLL